MGTSINSIGQPGSDYVYGALSSGSRINKAADGAAQMAIGQEFDRQNGGYEVGTNNLKDAKNAVNIADGALDGITSSLQRMRELALKASNGLMSDEDKQYIQAEVEQLKSAFLRSRPCCSRTSGQSGPTRSRSVRPPLR